MSCKTLFSSKLYSRLISLPGLNMSQYSYSTGLGDLGSGAGQGGGDGGSVRQAGGSFGKREAGLEGEYFNRLKQQQLDELKKTMHDDVKFHEEQIKRHQGAIEKIKSRINSAE